MARIGLALFPATRRIFERWIGSLISCVILQILIAMLLYIVLPVEQQVVNQIGSMPEGQLIGRIQVLLASVICFSVTGFVALQFRSVAALPMV